MTTEKELNLLEIPKPQRHGLIFRAFAGLELGDSLVLVNDHEPKHLRDEFDAELPGSFSWESLGLGEDGAWRVRITKTTKTAVPRIVGDATALADGKNLEHGGSLWQLRPAARGLDANVIALQPHGVIETHDGPDLDVVLHVLAGSGTLTTEAGEVALAEGAIVWLPQRSQRRFEAGDDGLRYFSVHQRKPMLNIMQRP